MIKSWCSLILLALLFVSLPSSALTEPSLEWNVEDIGSELGSQIIWDTRGYFEPVVGTVQSYETVGIITSTNENGDTTTYQTTGSGNYTTYTDNEFSIEFLSEEIPSYDQFASGEESLNSYFSTIYKNNAYSLSLDELVVFLFPTIVIDDNSDQVDIFSSETALTANQDQIRNLLRLSENATFFYSDVGYSIVEISDSDGQTFRYRSSGMLFSYTMINATHNIKIELDSSYFVEIDTEVGIPFFAYSLFVLSLIVVFRKKIINNW